MSKIERKTVQMLRSDSPFALIEAVHDHIHSLNDRIENDSYILDEKSAEIARMQRTIDKQQTELKSVFEHRDEVIDRLRNTTKAFTAANADVLALRRTRARLMEIVNGGGLTEVQRLGASFARSYDRYIYCNVIDKPQWIKLTVEHEKGSDPEVDIDIEDGLDDDHQHIVAWMLEVAMAHIDDIVETRNYTKHCKRLLCNAFITRVRSRLMDMGYEDVTTEVIVDKPS